jgi:hypothetical protein
MNTNTLTVINNQGKTFTVIDCYLMTKQIAQRYERLAPMRVLRAIDMIDNNVIEYTIYAGYYNYLTRELKQLDYWSYVWLSSYLGYYDNTSVKERTMLFDRLLGQYYRVRDDGRL